MIIALASPLIASSIDDGLGRVERLVADASARGAEVVCFPEAYLPGLRGLDFEVAPYDEAAEARVMKAVAGFARASKIAVIAGMERLTPAGRQVAACVFDARGALLGCQTKNQLDPTEDRFYVPGNARQVFDLNGTRFGIAICHEGWRYPETIRWAAARGAKVVFHPHHTGSDRAGVRLTAWGSAEAPYYEKAMTMRSIENAIYFAGVNYAMRYQESATAVIDPSGQCQAHLPYGEEGVLVQTIDVGRATGHLAARYAPDRYRDAATAPHPEHLIFAASHVTSFTVVCAEHDDAQTFAALRAYYALADAAARSAGGRLIKPIGDGVLLTFPLARAADALRALHDFHERTTAHWRAFDARCATQVRVGSGAVVSGPLGAPGDERFDIVGDALNRFFKQPWSDFDVAPSVLALLG